MKSFTEQTSTSMSAVSANFGLIVELEAYCGSATSMITLSIPPRKSMQSVNQLLKTDLGSKNNIKSPTNRANTIQAVKQIMRMVKDLRVKGDTLESTFPNGLVFLAGVCNDGSDVSFVLDPPQALGEFEYINSDSFNLEQLRNMVHSDDIIVFVVCLGASELRVHKYNITREEHKSVLKKKYPQPKGKQQKIALTPELVKELICDIKQVVPGGAQVVVIARPEFSGLESVMF